jgi:hypothetical protein
MPQVAPTPHRYSHEEGSLARRGCSKTDLSAQRHSGHNIPDVILKKYVGEYSDSMSTQSDDISGEHTNRLPKMHPQSSCPWTPHWTMAHFHRPEGIKRHEEWSTIPPRLDNKRDGVEFAIKETVGPLRV